MEDTIFEELKALVFSCLQLDCPVLSGNMQQHIEWEEVGQNFARIVISGPSYDISKWEKTGIIEYTGEYDYAVSVNNVGAFNGKSKKSKHWANKSLVKSCTTIANLYDGEVIVNVGL